MNAAQAIVRLQPIGVELIDRTMIDLAREIAMFRPTLDKFVRETPEAILWSSSARTIPRRTCAACAS